MKYILFFCAYIDVQFSEGVLPASNIYISAVTGFPCVTLLICFGRGKIFRLFP